LRSGAARCTAPQQLRGLRCVQGTLPVYDC
jgi:hypothetical protein